MPAERSPPTLPALPAAARSAATVGGGGEWMFAPHWSVFAEYNFMGFGSSNIQNVVVGVNYKF